MFNYYSNTKYIIMALDPKLLILEGLIGLRYVIIFEV